MVLTSPIVCLCYYRDVKENIGMECDGMRSLNMSTTKTRLILAEVELDYLWIQANSHITT